MNSPVDLINMIGVTQCVPYFLLLLYFFAESQYVLYYHRSGWDCYNCADGLT